ncbi:MAG: FAD-binding oxidoreductase [Thermostichus sp. BF3_bins_97]
MTLALDRASTWSAFQAELDGIPLVTDPTQVAKLSQDWSIFSPILTAKLAQKRADLVVCPTHLEQVLRLAKACVKHRIPITPRGTGTGNYGQAVPLYGGIVLDLSRMQQICWVKPGSARVEAGVKPLTLDKKAKEMGWEMRMIPSTFRTATLGGFVTGGSGGIGGIQFSGLAARGNVLAVQVVTLEDEPQVVELRGDALRGVNHGWGLNGIVTEVELPLAPAYPWAEWIVSFAEFESLMRFSQALAGSDGIVKKLISCHAWPIPSYFTALKSSIPEGSHCVLVMVAEPSLEPLQELVNEWGGQVCYRKTPQEASKGLTLAEFAINHTTLHARAANPNLTYIAARFPRGEAGIQAAVQVHEQFQRPEGPEVMLHIEFFRGNGTAGFSSLELVEFSTPERLEEIKAYQRTLGITFSNNHSHYIEDGMRASVQDVLDLKRWMDPYGLMNPGKTRLADPCGFGPLSGED